MLEQLLPSIAITAAALAAGLLRRRRQEARARRELGRHEQTERILAVLSEKQPGVWELEELRTRILQTARELWSSPTREGLDNLRMWLNADLFEEMLRAWPLRAKRREVALQIEPAIAFMHVREGGPEPDCLVARLMSRSQTDWFDERGRRIGREKRPLRATYHTWLHVDGQGWHLEDISSILPVDDPAPSSTTCHISSRDAAEEFER